MRFRLSVSLTCALLAAPCVLAGDNWPAFRGPRGDGTSDAKGIPTRWSETENIRWKTPIHGKGWSSPVIWGDQVWVTTANEEGVNLKAPVPRGPNAPGGVQKVTFFAIGIDVKTGKVLHDINLGMKEKPQYCHPFNSYASPTPVLEAGRLYAHFGSLGTWAVDTTSGKPLWERRDLKCDHFRGAGSSPILYNNLLFLIFDGFDVQYVVALDKNTGKTVWRADRNIKYKNDNGDYKKAYATPRVLEIDGKPNLICPSAECTIAYDPETGTELWRLTHGGMNGASRPIAGDGLMYLTSGHSGKLLAVKQSVHGEVPKDSIAWILGKGVPSRPSLLFHKGLLFLTSDNGIATAVDAKSGKALFTERLDGDTSASPILVGDAVYSCNQAGKTFVFSAEPEYNLISVNRLDDGCMASPAVADGALFIRTKAALYCIAKK